MNEAVAVAVGIVVDVGTGVSVGGSVGVSEGTGVAVGVAGCEVAVGMTRGIKRSGPWWKRCMCSSNNATKMRRNSAAMAMAMGT